jgi:hypothetical protein
MKQTQTQHGNKADYDDSKSAYTHQKYVTDNQMNEAVEICKSDSTINR